MLVLVSSAELDQTATHIMRRCCDVAIGAGGLASDDGKGLNEGLL
jgi:hypothetical protein